MSETNFTYVIKQVELALRPYIEAVCADIGMTPAQYTALTVLERRPGITTSNLARRSFVRAQSMAQTVDPLLHAGLVRRTRDPEHARRLLLHLTEAGSEVIARARPAVTAVEQLILADFTADESAAFADFLSRVRRSLDGGVPAGRVVTPETR